MFKMYAEYKDGFSNEFIADTEELCMCDIANGTEKHGECTFYTSVTDEIYECGELH